MKNCNSPSESGFSREQVARNAINVNVFFLSGRTCLFDRMCMRMEDGTHWRDPTVRSRAERNLVFPILWFVYFRFVFTQIAPRADVDRRF